MVARAQGRDFSVAQNPITADELRGLDFVFVKATEGDASFNVLPGQGTPVKNGVDPNFAHNWAVAKQAHIPLGAYHVLHPDRSAAKQAELFVDTVRAHGLAAGDILVNDVEIEGGDVDDAALKFCNETRRLAGPLHPVLAYANQNFGRRLLKTAARYPGVWFAHPSDEEPTTDFIAPFTHWVFFQFGEINRVDADKFHGTKEDLKDWIARFLVPPKAPEPFNEDHLRHLWHIVHTGEADLRQRQLQTLWIDFFAGLAMKPNPDAHEKHVLTFAQHVLHVELV